jgi:hypothetical protein
MTTQERPRSSVYELTVVGALGPVLRCALGPEATAYLRPQTVMRADFPDGADLVDVVLLLEARGLEIAQVSALT